jgi:hypothetical protein
VGEEHPAARLGELLEVSGRELTTPANGVAALLACRAVGSSLLILIDQLEELFTLAEAGGAGRDAERARSPAERAPLRGRLHPAPGSSFALEEQ